MEKGEPLWHPGSELTNASAGRCLARPTRVDGGPHGWLRKHPTTRVISREPTPRQAGRAPPSATSGQSLSLDKKGKDPTENLIGQWKPKLSFTPTSDHTDDSPGQAIYTVKTELGLPYGPPVRSCPMMGQDLTGGSYPRNGRRRPVLPAPIRFQNPIILMHSVYLLDYKQ